MLALRRLSARSVTARLFSSNVRDSGGAFSKREKAEEERWIYEHEKENLKKFKEELSHRPAPKAAAPKSEASAQETVKETIQPHGVTGTYGGAVRSAGGAFGKKEAAIEEKYFRDHDRELLEKMKKNKKN